MKHLCTLFLITFLVAGCQKDIDLKQVEFLNGQVKLIHEKSYLVSYDSAWNTSPILGDTLAIYYVTRYYKKNGINSLAKYYRWDSTLISTSEKYYSRSGRFEGSKSYDSEGRLKEFTNVIAWTTDSASIEKYDQKSQELKSIATTHYDNGLVKTQESYSYKDKHLSVFEFIRDNSGNITERIWSSSFEDEQFSDTSNIKNLEYDNMNNWIKQIGYDDSDKKGSLRTRKIEYY